MRLRRRHDRSAPKYDFKGSVDGLEEWAARFGRLDASRQLEVLDVLRAHGAAFRPSAVLSIAEAGIAFTPELRVGVERMTAFADVDSVTTLFLKAPRQADELARAAATAPDTDAAVFRAIAADADRAIRLFAAADNPGQVLSWVRAAGAKAGLVDDLLQLARRPLSGGAQPLEALEVQGLERLLQRGAGSDADAAAAKLLLDDPMTSRAFMRGAAQADDAALAKALRNRKFDPWHTQNKSMRVVYRGENTGTCLAHPSWRTRYLDDAGRAATRVSIRGGKMYRADGQPFDTSGNRTAFSGTGRAIYVMDNYGNIYVGSHDVGKFHHSSFLGGEKVAAAGEIAVSNGKITYLNRKSGHYYPDDSHRAQMIAELQNRGVDMTGVTIEAGF